MTGLGLNTSDVNIDVQFNAEAASAAVPVDERSSTSIDANSTASEQSHHVTWSAAKVMVKIAQILKEEACLYQDVKTDFQSKVPCIFAKDASNSASALNYVISTGNLLSCETSKLLKTYAQIDPRATKLAILFRYLGKLLEIDDPCRGTMPPYCLTLMAIYYCQKCTMPVLPVLQALYPIKSNKLPEIMVEGRNCYFFDDLSNL